MMLKKCILISCLINLSTLYPMDVLEPIHVTEPTEPVTPKADAETALEKNNAALLAREQQANLSHQDSGVFSPTEPTSPATSPETTTSKGNTPTVVSDHSSLVDETATDLQAIKGAVDSSLHTIETDMSQPSTQAQIKSNEREITLLHENCTHMVATLTSLDDFNVIQEYKALDGQLNALNYLQNTSFPTDQSALIIEKQKRLITQLTNMESKISTIKITKSFVTSLTEDIQGNGNPGTRAAANALLGNLEMEQSKLKDIPVTDSDFSLKLYASTQKIQDYDRRIRNLINTNK